MKKLAIGCGTVVLVLGVLVVGVGYYGFLKLRSTVTQFAELGRVPEIEREGPSYTYETLELLADQRGDSELVFVMGADAAVGLESWREPERVVELARIAVARRAGVSDSEVAAVMRSLGAAERATMLEMPQFGVSSSAVRERAAVGRPLRYLVPEPVARFVEEKGIYR